MFSCCEQEQFSHTISISDLKVPMLVKSRNGRGLHCDDDKESSKSIHVRCSDDSTICSVSMVTEMTHQVSIKYRAGRAPQNVDLYLILFDSAYCTNVVEIWQVTINIVARLDVNCLYGQANEAKLALKGLATTHQAIAYSSAPSLIQLPNSDPFTLYANRMAELDLVINNPKLENFNAIVNVVDIETKTLLNSYMIIAKFAIPKITKVFEIRLQKGTKSNKRVSYTNPFNHKSTLYLKSSRPDLVNFKSDILQLNAKQMQFICLRFAPTHLNSTEIYVFLNNEQDKIEECLLINVKYKE